MKTFLFSLILFSTQILGANPVVVMETSKGNIEIELFEDKAPETVKNFLGYVKDDFYDGTIFHRIIDDFMIQGGGYTVDLKKKSTKKPIKNEAANKVSNAVGTIAMARTGDPHSATAQFFINVSDNSQLDFTSPTPSGFGYTVFGKVKKGMTVVNKIKKVATRRNGPHGNLPLENIIIKKVSLKK